jgi:hypothetical protein
MNPQVLTKTALALVRNCNYNGNGNGRGPLAMDESMAATESV